MEGFVGYIIENPSRVFFSVTAIGIALFASSLQGMNAIFARLLAIFTSFLAMMM